jgi:hypothetical protein
VIGDDVYRFLKRFGGQKHDVFLTVTSGIAIKVSSGRVRRYL